MGGRFLSLWVSVSLVLSSVPAQSGRVFRQNFNGRQAPAGHVFQDGVPVFQPGRGFYDSPADFGRFASEGLDFFNPLSPEADPFLAEEQTLAEQASPHLRRSLPEGDNLLRNSERTLEAEPWQAAEAVEGSKQQGRPTWTETRAAVTSELRSEGLGDRAQDTQSHGAIGRIFSLLTGQRRRETVSPASFNLGSAVPASINAIGKRAWRSTKKPAQPEEDEVPAPPTKKAFFSKTHVAEAALNLVGEFAQIEADGAWQDAAERKSIGRELLYFVAIGRDKDGSPELALEVLEEAIVRTGVMDSKRFRETVIGLNDITDLGIVEIGDGPSKRLHARGVDNGGFTATQRKATLGLALARPFGILGGTLGGMAYPMLLMSLVSIDAMMELFSIGSVISIGMNIFVGKIGKHLDPKKFMITNGLLRSALSAANGFFYAQGWLSFEMLLILTVINAFQFASLFITDEATTAEIMGPNRKKIYSTMVFVRTLGLIIGILTGIFLGKAIVDNMGFVWTYSIITVVSAIPAFILWKTLPALGVPRGNEPLGKLIKGYFKKTRENISALPWKKIGKRFLQIVGLGMIFSTFFVSTGTLSPFPKEIAFFALMLGGLGSLKLASFIKPKNRAPALPPQKRSLPRFRESFLTPLS